MTHESPEKPIELAGDVTILVLGVGGAGCQAVEHLAAEGLAHVRCVGINTDAQALSQCQRVPQTFVLGRSVRRGLGAGGDPEQGRTAAEVDSQKLGDIVRGASIVLLLAGLGGGTGTGAAPVIARLAREAGALVLGIVTLPFDCEGSRRMRQAQLGLEQLKAAADGVICVPNQKVFKFIDENTSLPETFRIITAHLAHGVRGIWRLLTQPGLMRVDFADLCAITQGRHAESTLATAEAMGENRARELAERLLTHPLLDEAHLLSQADGLLVSLLGGPDLTMADVNRVMEQLHRHAENAQIVLGTAIDSAMQGRLAATLVVSRSDRTRSERTIAAATQRVGDLASPAGVRTTGPAAQAELIRPDDDRASRSAKDPVAPGLAATTDRPAPELAPKRVPPGARGRRPQPQMRQTQLPLEAFSKGRFAKTLPTVLHGEDLDVPTYIRRGIPLN